ncbi:MAG: tetratricopeptide repeat protein [Pirellulaceae bacterium]|nr:tetratricopeptide repeat protein [Pirellulaceae bacterium]
MSSEREQLNATILGLQQAIQHDSENAQAFYELGIAFNMAGDHQSARDAYSQSLLLTPDNADANYNLAYSYCVLEELDKAKEAYWNAIRLRPTFAEAYNNLGKVCLQCGSVVEAVLMFQTACSLKPELVEFQYNLGIAQQENQQWDAAARSYQSVLAIQPNHIESLNNLGNVYKAQGKFALAVNAYRDAISLDPSFANAYFNLGISLSLMGSAEAAIDAFRKSISLCPDHAESHLNLGVAFQELQRVDEAIQAFRNAYALGKGYGAGALLHQLQHICDWKELDALTSEVMTRIEYPEKQSIDDLVTPLTALALPCVTTSEQQFACARAWVSRLDRTKNSDAKIAAIPKSPHAKIRLGYLSGDFGTHPVGYLIAELIEAHDRGQFEVFGFATKPSDQSALSQRFEKGFDQLIYVDREGFEDAAKMIADKGIAILVDLQGYTRGARTEIMAQRAASIQVNYLGYAGTMGAQFIDYIIADAFVVPADRQSFYAEQIVHLPDCFMVNDRLREIDATTPTRMDEGLPENGFVFCAFSSAVKITPKMFDVWLRLLEATPNSVLWLRQSNPTTIRNLSEYAIGRGLAKQRLIFSQSASMPKHLARHRLADLYLDTFPYNQHSTAGDAIRMGVPLVTLAGESFASRVAGSLLHAVGLPELITYSVDDYEKLATQLANERDRLLGMRRRLARNLVDHSLYDGRHFATNIEKAYTLMWEVFQRRESPRPLAIRPE